MLTFSNIHRILPPHHSTGDSSFDAAFASARRPFCCLVGGSKVALEGPLHSKKPNKTIRSL